MQSNTLSLKRVIWDKIFTKGLSTTYRTQPLKKLRRYGLLKQTISLQIFKSLYSKNFTWSILEYVVSLIELPATILKRFILNFHNGNLPNTQKDFQSQQTRYCENVKICSKLEILNWYQWPHLGVFILIETLNMFSQVIKLQTDTCSNLSFKKINQWPRCAQSLLFTCLNPTMEIPKKCMKYVQS